jgi:hypothetical protein
MDINEDKAENTPAGGVLVGKKDGQTIIHDKGTMSGYLVGKLHKDGGIKAVNKATGQPLEMQGGEVIITAPAVSDQTKREFEGKMMTNREILSAINEKGGGVSFANGGDIPAKIHTNDCEYKLGGKVVKDTDIAHSLGMNSTLKKGKQQFSSGDTTYDVDAIYNAIKKGKLRLKTKEVETFPMKYPVYDKKYSETVKTDFRKPNGITVRTESGEEVLIDGNHRMNNAYLKGRKTMKTYYIEDPKQIAKFTKKNKFELGGENKMGGHLSSGKSLKQIAEMHNVSLAHINEELAKGLEVEKEHFADFKERTRVAKDHLVENPNYYTILEKAGLKNGGHILSHHRHSDNLVKDAKSGNTPARDLNNYNDVMDLEADGMVGMESGLAFAKGGQVSNFFKKTYGNLVEKQGIITTKTDWFNKDGVKVLEYGFDPYRYEKGNTLFFYSWDYDDSGMDYDDFKEQLVDFFKKTYKKDVSELKALYVGWDRKEKDTYADGGITPIDANIEGDSVDIVESDFAKGGVVYDTTKPKIEKVTIKETKTNRVSVVGRNASNISELQQIIADYVRNSNEQIDWVSFYVNDTTRGNYYIDLNKDKRNTVKNVNPKTVDSINIKRVIDGKTYLVKNYDWTEFFGGQKKSGKDNSVIRIAVMYDSKSKASSSNTNLVNSTLELYNFLRGLHNGDYENVKIQPIGNGLGVNPIELNLSTFSWDNLLTMTPEESAVKEINRILYGLFPELDFDKFVRSASATSVVEQIEVKYLDKDGNTIRSLVTNDTKELYDKLVDLRKNNFADVSVLPMGSSVVAKPKYIPISNNVWEYNLYTLNEDEGKRYTIENISALFPDLNFSKFKVLKSATTSTQAQYPEYYEYVNEDSTSFSTGKIYKIVNPKDIEAGQNFIDNGGIPNGFSGSNSEKFKPSTEEAFLAQQSGVSSISSLEPKIVDAVNVEFVYPNGRIEVSATINISSLKNALANFWNIVNKKSWEVRITPFENQFTPFEEKKLIIGNDFAEFNPETFSEEQLGNKLKTLYPDLDWSDFFEEAQTPTLIPNEVKSIDFDYSNKQYRTDYKDLKSEDFLDAFKQLPDNNPDNEDIAIRITANYDGKSIYKIFTATVYPIDPNNPKENTISIISDEKEVKDFLKKKLFPELNFDKYFGDIPSSKSVVPKTVETSISDLDEAVQKLEKASSIVATEYNKEIYDQSLKFLYDTKATYELALKFTPESAFMYERLDILKKLADIEKKIKNIEDMKKGGAFYMLAKILEKLERGEYWRQSETEEEVITNAIPQSEIDIIIRSQKFKNWFGDWEKALVNDEYDNVSKALTDGIPSVYHHGARRIKYTYREVSNGVLYLAENISYATWFSQNATAQTEEGNYLTECFVNIKNPIDLTAFHVNKVDLADIVRYVDAVYPMAKIYDYIPAQVALLIKTNQPTNVRMWAWQLIRSYAKFVNHIKENTPYDGFLYYENNPSDQVTNPVTGQLEENVTKAVAIFKSPQVKVVDAVLFDGGLDDWRFENGGKIKN